MNINIQATLQTLFYSHISKGNIDDIKSLIKKEQFHHNVYYNGLWQACRTAHIEIVEYFLTSPDISPFIDIHLNNDSIFCTACEYSNLDMIKFLLNFPDIKTSIDIHAQQDYPFKAAFNNDKFDIIEHFIFEQKIHKTSQINQHLNQYPNEKIEHWFTIRALNQSLQNELSITNNHKNKKKL